ncbi:glycoside hydrolase family 16 protein [Microbacterium sp. M1A1_1b]
MQDADHTVNEDGHPTPRADRAPRRRMRVSRFLLVTAAVVAAGVTLGSVSTADARPAIGDRPSPSPSAATPTPTPTLAPPTTAPSFAEDFDTNAASGGQFAATYANAWQPYPDAMSNKYYSGEVISAHDGIMDVAMDGTRGAAGTFGTQQGAWSHVGGTFSVRARATGGDDNGAAFMLWPTSNVWSEGELDFPEGTFQGTVGAFSHAMTPGQERHQNGLHTTATWRTWHTYTTVWVPGESVKYYVDGTLVFADTQYVPTTAHRYMFQIGNKGEPGNLEIDWVRIWSATGG